MGRGPTQGPLGRKRTSNGPAGGEASEPHRHAWPAAIPQRADELNAFTGELAVTYTNESTCSSPYLFYDVPKRSQDLGRRCGPRSGRNEAPHHVQPRLLENRVLLDT